jgi:hypothetical protein
MQNDKWFEVKNAILAQFGTELAAGKHKEWPSLRQLWLDDVATRAEQDALVQACFEVAHGVDVNGLAEN